MYCIAGNFHEFCGFVAIYKSFFHENWDIASFGTAKMSNLRTFSPQKSYFSQIRKSFLPWKFPAIRIYGNYYDVILQLPNTVEKL